MIEEIKITKIKCDLCNTTIISNDCAEVIANSKYLDLYDNPAMSGTPSKYVHFCKDCYFNKVKPVFELFKGTSADIEDVKDITGSILNEDC